MYSSYDDIPEANQQFICMIAGVTDVKQIPLDDINGFVSMIEESNETQG